MNFVYLLNSRVRERSNRNDWLLWNSSIRVCKIVIVFFLLKYLHFNMVLVFLKIKNNFKVKKINARDKACCEFVFFFGAKF